MTPVAATSSIDRAVIFVLDGERYGVSLDCVQEVLRIVAFSGAHTHSETVIGMVNVRGAIAPVVDMRAVAGLPKCDLSPDTPMLICRVGEQLVALVADAVEDILEVPEGRVQPVPALHPLAAELAGTCQVDGAVTYLLDVEALLADVAALEAV